MTFSREAFENGYLALFDDQTRSAHLAALIDARCNEPSRWPTVPIVRKIARLFEAPAAELGRWALPRHGRAGLGRAPVPGAGRRVGHDAVASALIARVECRPHKARRDVHDERPAAQTRALPPVPQAFRGRGRIIASAIPAPMKA